MRELLLGLLVSASLATSGRLPIAGGTPNVTMQGASCNVFRIEIADSLTRAKYPSTLYVRSNDCGSFAVSRNGVVWSEVSPSE